MHRPSEKNRLMLKKIKIWDPVLNDGEITEESASQPPRINGKFLFAICFSEELLHLRLCIVSDILFI